VNYRESIDWLRGEIMAAIADWWSTATRNPHAEFYCYCKPGSVVIVANDPGDDYELVTPERISSMHTRQSLFGWLWDRLQSASCLPPE